MEDSCDDQSGGDAGEKEDEEQRGFLRQYVCILKDRFLQTLERRDGENGGKYRRKHRKDLVDVFVRF